jgi:hypothetical protein
VAAVGEGGKEGGIFGIDVVTVAGQVEFADDALLQRAGEVRSGGDAEARPDLLGNGAAAHHFAPLQDA